MRRSVRAMLVVAMSTVLLSGCGKSATRAPTPTGSSSAYMLYTHCGIWEANIDGRWFAAVEPLSDGQGNPPKGWGNPYQAGTISFVSDTEADFTDSVGHHVRFILEANASGPQHVCS